MKNFSYFLYILILGLWTGGVFIFTFVVTPVIFRTYGRDRAGEIVGSLFPTYFIFTIVIAALALLLLFAAQPVLTPAAFKVSLGLTVLALCISLYVRGGLYPQIQEVKQAVRSFETTAADDPMRAKFGRLHAVSAVLNLVFLADGVVLMALGTLLKK
ncbi:MAG: DUF4149 domain-containing protein [Thermodesulfovibrio sp.]|nr:DUF4149 domain-containing protein [Thermodesulfovibrio sp.]